MYILATIQIDPRDPKAAHASAHAVVSQICEKWKDKQSDWTEEEIQEAKLLSRKMLLEYYTKEFGGLAFASKHYGGIKSTFLRRVTFSGDVIGEVWSGPRGHDVYNEKIGACVCLCKLLKKPIPEFIKNKNR